MARLKLGLRNLSIPETIVKGNSILFRMRNNPNFPPDTIPPLSQIEDRLTELKTVTLDAMNHDKIQVAIRNSKKEKFLILLRMLGGWISSQTTNEIAIMSTGFDVADGNGRSRQILKPEMVRRTFNPNTNILKFIWQPVPGAKQYIVETSNDPYSNTAQWSIAAYTSQAKYIPNREQMKPLTFYYYRVRALGTKGIGPPSNIVKGAIF